MQWIAPSEKDTGPETLENRLWAAADELRANSGLTSAQYYQPVLGLIFLRFAEVRFLTQLAVVLIVSSGIATLMSFFRGVVMCRVPWSMDHRNGAGGSARSSHENAPD